MNTRTSLYRSTLVAAALAVGSFGAASVASAHEQGDRDGDRHGAYTRHGGHERGAHGEHRGWGYYRAVPTYRPYYREPARDDERAYLAPGAYYPRLYEEPPVVVYRPTRRAEVLYDDPNVSVMIHVPL